MKKNRLRTALCLLLAGTVLAAFAALAADTGGRDDPLVTLSYLNGTYLSRLLDEVDGKLEERERELLAGLSGAPAAGGTVQPGGETADFVPVTLPAGRALRGTAGCEILFRSGSAACLAPAGTAALADTTSGGAVSGGGALTANHLYLILDSAGVQAASSASMLVRGDYYIE